MSMFNDKLVEGLFGGKYICSECDAEMEFETEWRDVLICNHCGHSVDLDRYGFENDEDYDALYPTKEEVMGYEEGEDDEDEEDTGEVYDEVCGELSN